MKKIIYLLPLAFVFIAQQASATIKRCNNNPGIVADYNNIDSALVYVATWDTLYLEPSATPYDITLAENAAFQAVASAKHIFGAGYHLAQNGAVNPLQVSTHASVLQKTDVGNAQLSFRNNWHLHGLTVNNNLKFTPETIDVNMDGISDCIIEHQELDRCLLTAGYSTAFVSAYVNTNSVLKCEVIIKQCNILNIASGDIYFTLTANTSVHPSSNINVLIENNIYDFGPAPSMAFSFDNYLLNYGYLNVVNNTFKSTSTPFSNLIGTFFANNIVDSTLNFYTGIGANNFFSHNLFLKDSVGYGAPSGSNQVFINNTYGYTEASVFTNGGLTSNDGKYMTDGSSAAYNKGIPNNGNAVTVGAFGGPNPYVLSGIPSIPTIYQLSLPATVQQGTNTNITISTRTNK